MADADGGFPGSSACCKINFSVKAGEKHCNFSVPSVAATADEAFRDVKELLRSESRAWRSYGVFRQLNLLLSAHRRREEKATDAPSPPLAANAGGLLCEGGSSQGVQKVAAPSSSGNATKDGVLDFSAGGLSLPLRTRSSSTMSHSSSGRYSLTSSLSSTINHGLFSSNSASSSRRPTLHQLPPLVAVAPAAESFLPSEEEEAPPAASVPSALLPFALSASVLPASAAVRVFFEQNAIARDAPAPAKAEEALDAQLPDLTRPATRLQLLQSMMADCAAATIQRFFRGYFVRMRFHAAMLFRRLLVQQQTRESEAATVLQRAWRSHTRRRIEYRQNVLREIQHQRESAAIKIQAAWRRRQREFFYQVQRVADCMESVRRAAAIEIQRVWRGRRCRRTLDEEYEKWVVTWIWDRPSSIVEVVGDFSSPPWTRRYLMNYCKQRECFVLTLPRVPGRHELKFIVNGRHVCDGNQPVISDGCGQFNNLIRVRPAVKSQFKVIRERLADIAMKQRFQERSFSSPVVPHAQWQREHERTRQKQEIKRQQEREEEMREKQRAEREQLRREEEEWLRRQEAIKEEHLQFVRRQQIQQEKQYLQSVRDKKMLMEEQRRRVERRCRPEEMARRRELEAREKEVLQGQMRKWKSTRRYDAEFLGGVEEQQSKKEEEEPLAQEEKQAQQRVAKKTEREKQEPWLEQQQRLLFPEHDLGFDSDSPIVADMAFGDLMKSPSRSNDFHGEGTVDAKEEAAKEKELHTTPQELVAAPQELLSAPEEVISTPQEDGATFEKEGSSSSCDLLSLLAEGGGCGGHDGSERDCAESASQEAKATNPLAKDSSLQQEGLRLEAVSPSPSVEEGPSANAPLVLETKPLLALLDATAGASIPIPTPTEGGDEAKAAETAGVEGEEKEKPIALPKRMSEWGVSVASLQGTYPVKEQTRLLPSQVRELHELAEAAAVRKEKETGRPRRKSSKIDPRVLGKLELPLLPPAPPCRRRKGEFVWNDSSEEKTNSQEYCGVQKEESAEEEEAPASGGSC